MSENKTECCATCGQAFPLMTEDAKLAYVLRAKYMQRYMEIKANASSVPAPLPWYALDFAEREAWLAVVVLARKELTNVQTAPVFDPGEPRRCIHHLFDCTECNWTRGYSRTAYQVIIQRAKEDR
jgi:hypothetical protein